MTRRPEIPGLQVLSDLGTGGTARVSRVYADRYRRQLAIKYPLDEHPDTLKKFRRVADREWALIGGQRFPGLVRIVELRHDPLPHLILDLCPGPTLDLCGRVENLQCALNILSVTALVLEYLRCRSLIHGDLKPHNIFLPVDWENLVDKQFFYIKLSDFSLGRRLDETDLDRAGVGTVGYMAPEMVSDSVTSHQTDLFALGVIAYQVLTGVHPFMDEDNDPVKVNARVREETPPPISRQRPEAPAELSHLVERLLARDPSDRPASAWEVCRLLREAGAGYPYERALNPKYLVSADADDSIGDCIDLSDGERGRLRHLSDNDPGRIRCIIAANFARGNLHYTGSNFRFESGVYWPAHLRQRALRQFSGYSPAARIKVVRASIVGDTHLAKELRIVDDDFTRRVPTFVFDLLPHLLRQRTVAAYAGKIAPRAEKAGDQETATRLYLRAGELEAAARCTDLATDNLCRNHQGDVAIGLIGQVLSLADSLGRLAEVRRLLMRKGDIFKQSGDTESAETVYQTITGLYDHLPPDELLAETYKDLGDLYRMKQDRERGFKALNRALEICRQLGNELEVSRTYNNIGNIHLVSGELPEALTNYRTALRMQRRLQALPEIASTLTNIGSVHAILGRFDRSVRIMNQALRMKREIGDLGEIARSLNNLGYVHHVGGQPSRAVSCLAESLDINRRIGSKKEILYNLENLTEVMLTAGRLAQAQPLLNEGMDLARSLGDKPHLAAFHRNLGVASHRMGRFFEAGDYLARAREIIDEIDEPIYRIRIQIELANLRRGLGDHGSAFELANRARQKALSLNDKSNELSALLMLVRVSNKDEYVKRTLALAGELHLRRESILARWNRAEYLLENDRPDEAVQAAGELLSTVDSDGEDIELPRLCNLAAELLLRDGRIEAATQCLTRAEEFEQRSGLLPEMVTTLTLLGKMELADNNYERSYRLFKRALQVSRQISDNISDAADRTAYQTQRMITFLAREVRALADVIGNGIRAGR